MSRETPDAYNASIIRKSLTAFSRTGHPNPTLVPAQKSTLESHRIFNLSLAPLKPFSPSRLGSKTRPHAHKHADLGLNGSFSLDEDDSMYTEQDSLETDNSATDLPTELLSPAHAPPGLPPPPRYPIIVPVKNNVVPRPGVPPPKHWAPGGRCETVRIEPPPPMRFLPRPGYDPPSYWNPGGRATRLDRPVPESPDSDDSPTRIERSGSESSALDQDDTYATISTSISSASENDAGTQDPIHAQLEHILDMDDALLAAVNLPAVPQSVWATCPTVTPSLAADLFSLRTAAEPEGFVHVAELSAARFPVPVESFSAGNAPDGDEVAAEEDADLDLETLDDHDCEVSFETVASVLEEILQTLDAEEHESETPVPALGLEPAAFIHRYNARFFAVPAPHFDPPRLTRSRSLLSVGGCLPSPRLPSRPAIANPCSCA
ncbi:hypothetical protein K438DRAFT_1995965 [Mycena galopus ATCC 62051]|nr:hypothetical protein K438DRAFT_1995965 [Mycena galopus ATCC 62051]